MRRLFIMSAAASLTMACGARAIVETTAYRWEGDSIIQGDFVAYAPSDTRIVSSYAAQPGYFMPIDKEWNLKNDISAYPQLRSSNRLHRAIYNLGLDEMVNAVEPDTTLRTGKEWAGVWTRDVSYSIILSMAYLQPEASRISLEKKVTPTGRIVQDTGSGGAWPVSSDRMIWAVAAWEVYKVTGDRQWLEFIYPVIKNSLEDDFQVTYVDGGVNGETSFIDWREQSYPKWMQTADIYASQAQNTGAVHVAALDVLSQIADELGNKAEAEHYKAEAEKLNASLKEKFWNDDKGYFNMYIYGRDFPIANPRSETLGQAFAILYGQLEPEQAKKVTENVPTTPFGPGIFFPQIADMPPYHNNSLWPWVASMWTLANAEAGNEQGVLEGIGSVFRPAALFTTNKENFVLDNGDIATELNSSNMLWCLSGNLAITHKVLFGIHFEKDGLRFAPFVPKALADTRELLGFKYRDAVLNITVEGYGDRIASFTVNGKKMDKPFIPADVKGEQNIVIRMADNDIEPLSVNHTANVKAPLTPIARLTHEPSLGTSPVLNLLTWQPIEYIAKYIVLRDGNPVAETRRTSFEATTPGEYQIIGVSGDGVQSFASEPVSNRAELVYKPSNLATQAISEEIAYQPATPIAGYSGAGFAETDHAEPIITIPVTLPESGRYSISFIYANGNGPVNTENRCAIRTVTVNDRKVGTVVMPQRGVANWDDWGLSNSVIADLPAGPQTIALEFTPADENMNLKTNHALVDRVIVKKL